MRAIILLLLVLGTLGVPTKPPMGVQRTRRQTSGSQTDKWWQNPAVNNQPETVNNQPETVNVRDGIPNKGTGDEFGSHSITEDHVDVPQSSVKTGSKECNGPGTECLPYYQCRDGQVITDGSGLIDIRVTSVCPRYLDICCKVPHLPDHTTPTQPYNPRCGHRNTDGVDVSVSGLDVTQTQFGEFPWMTAILRVETIGQKDVNLYLCGGSLIFPDVILTAAHCIQAFDAFNLKVRAGEWDTQSSYETYPHEDRLVKDVIIHPDYNGGSLHNDYAILILKNPFILSHNIDTVCLPEINDNFFNKNCFATGWGKDKFGKGGQFQNILKQVKLNLVAHGKCEQNLRTSRLGEHFVLHDSFLCAGGEPGVDTCKGDGGSPLVCPTTDFNGITTYYQVGIVAWGIGCGEDNIPGVYANVIAAVDWIKYALFSYDQNIPI